MQNGGEWFNKRVLKERKKDIGGGGGGTFFSFRVFHFGL